MNRALHQIANAASVLISIVAFAQPLRAADVAKPKVSGAELFRAHCAICHAAGGTGTMMLSLRLPTEVSPLLAERKDLQRDYVETVVRTGIGSMPWFTRVELPDAALREIVGYLSSTAPTR